MAKDGPVVRNLQKVDRIGKGAARELRRQGLVPAVIYGDKTKPVTVALPYKEIHKAIYAGGFLSHTIDLDVDGTRHRVIPRDYQLDPVKDFPIHVDFLRVGKDAKINVQVPVHFINEEASPGLKRGGTLNVVHHTVDLTVSADNIPEAVIVDLTGLDIGDTVHFSAIKLPAGTINTSHEDDLTIATVVADRNTTSEPLVIAASLLDLDQFAEASDEEAEEVALEIAGEAVRRYFSDLLGEPGSHLSQVRAILSTRGEE